MLSDNHPPGFVLSHPYTCTAPPFAPRLCPHTTHLPFISARGLAIDNQGLAGQTDYNIQWSSSTSPPIIDPFSFVAYGYGSCSGWATIVTYMAKAVGIPARQVGTPCWNQAYGSMDYSGLAIDNPNVSICWNGGIGSPDHTVGGIYLNNHNWVEYWDTDSNKW